MCVVRSSTPGHSSSNTKHKRPPASPKLIRSPGIDAQAGRKRIVELGCGNGSTLFPLLAANENPLLDLHGYDYSKEAVSVVKVRVRRAALGFSPVPFSGAAP